MSALIIPNESVNPSERELGNSHIGARNVINAATLVASTDNDHVGYLNDNMTSLYWEGGAGSTVTCTFASTGINYVAIAGVNWSSAGLTLVVTVGGQEVVNASGYLDGQPMMWQFDEIITGTIVYTFSSACKVGEIGFGQTVKFPCLPNVGLTLGKFTNTNTMFGKTTENQLMAGTSLIRRARETRASYGLISIDWVRENWINFINTQMGIMVWFMWDSVGEPEDISYGHWTTNQVGYERSTFANIDFNVKGDAR